MKKRVAALAMITLLSIYGIVSANIRLQTVLNNISDTHNELHAIYVSDTLDFITDGGCQSYKYGKCINAENLGGAK